MYMVYTFESPKSKRQHEKTEQIGAISFVKLLYEHACVHYTEYVGYTVFNNKKKCLIKIVHLKSIV